MDSSGIDKDKIIEEINALKLKLDAKKVKALQINRLDNIVNKLARYSDNCSECRNFMSTFEHDLLDNVRSLDKSHLKSYMVGFRKIVSHLCKKHKHVEPGTYMGMYMSIGTSFGMLFGMMIGFGSDNNGSSYVLGMSMGMCFGMTLGISIGSMLDANAKKKGKVI